jgi:hypothetical protein
LRKSKEGPYIDFLIASKDVRRCTIDVSPVRLIALEQVHTFVEGFHSTVVMNKIHQGRVICLFPKLTLRYKQALKIEYMIDLVEKKWQNERGYTIVNGLSDAQPGFVL